MTTEQADRLWSVNVRAVFVASQAAARHMGEGGRIITIGSALAERVPAPGMTLYTMSKAALTGLTKGLARDLGPRGITATVVHGGLIDTDMNPADGPRAEFIAASRPSAATEVPRTSPPPSPTWPATAAGTSAARRSPSTADLRPDADGSRRFRTDSFRRSGESTLALVPPSRLEDVAMAQQAGATLDSAEFASRTEPFRRELLAHCYRMLGSVDEAEDLVQETYLRAWRSYGGFEGRSSVRTWLYQIATNACLTACSVAPGARCRPASAAPAATGPRGRRGRGGGVAAADPGRAGDTGNRRSRGRRGLPGKPAAGADRQPAVPAARQRAVLILREVLDFPAAEVAGMLGMTTTAVKSALQRARARLQQASPSADQVAEPTEPEARALLEGYIAAFENSDAVALERLLRKDAMLELPPSAAWFAGGEAIAQAVRGLGSPGDWRMIPTRERAACRRRLPARRRGVYRAYAIVVLTVRTAGIARLVVFGDTGLFPAFGFAPVLPAGPAASR